MKDVYALTKLFSIYLLWLYMNRIHFVKYAQEKINRLKNDKPPGPFAYYVDKYFEVK